MSKNLKEIKITNADFEYIMGDDYQFFQQKIIPNCFCGHCYSKKGTVSIVNYEIFIDSFNGVRLQGFCKECRGKVVRCLELEEVPKHLKKVVEIRKKLNAKQNNASLPNLRFPVTT